MAADAADVLLDVRDIAVRFGAVVGLGGVSFSVHRGEILGLIGPNGSGKTTLFNCISGFYRPQRGEVRLSGQVITGLPRHRMAALGIGRTFQNLALFNSMTVRENVLVGAHPLGRSGFFGNALCLPRARREAAAAEARLGHVLALLDLVEHAHRPVAELPFGTAKRVEIARALIAGPQLLLLDEPACGLNHTELEEMFALLLRLRARSDLTIVLVEHHMSLVMRLCEHVVVLAAGVKIADGPPEAVQKNLDVVQAYLGVARDKARAA
jgi:branched-chain amino acid transport system ATP-binding protein